MVNGSYTSLNFRWTINNIDDVNASLLRLAKETSDFRIPFRLIASDFYRSQKKLFTLKGKGLWDDLSPKYKVKKAKNPPKGAGFVYPILVGKSRALSQSTLSKDAKYAVFGLSKDFLTIGSSVPYGKFHQSDEPRTKMPQRKFIFIDGGAGDMSKDGVNGRRERWISIVDTHLNQLINGI